MKFCSNCGNELKENAKFCASCGTPVTEETKKVEEKIDEALNDVVAEVNNESNKEVVKDVQENVVVTNNSDSVQVGITEKTAINEQKTNTMSLVGFILSIVSIVCCCCSFSGLALILSIIGLIQINKTNEKGKGFAITGIVVGGIGVILLIILSALGTISDAANSVMGISAMIF